MAEEKKKLLPSVYAESVYLIEGQDFRLTGRNYLKVIYDAHIVEGILKCGRQVEKSTTFSTHILNWAMLEDFFRALYVAPTNEQVKAFSKGRLAKLMRYSKEDIIRKIYQSPELTDQVMHKELTNGSEIYFRHCYEEADNIRGISANGVFIDEIQDIIPDAIPVIGETQSHALDMGPKKKITWYSGTPKSFSNTIQERWEMSTQAEWVIKCPHCGTHQILGVANMRPDKYVCRKCEGTLTEFIELEPGRFKTVFDVRGTGFWKEKIPGKQSKGFRISQLMVTWIPPQEIWLKYQTYPTAKFYNEVLGLSYENADKPFNARMLEEITNRDLDIFTRAEGIFANAPIFMGVDWGTGEKSYTIVTLFSWNYQTNKFQMLYHKKFAVGRELDTAFQLDHISRLMYDFKVVLALVDWGFGEVQIQELRKRFGVRVAACFYSHASKSKIDFDPVKQRYVVNRTMVLQDYVQLVQNHQVEWPGKDRPSIQYMHDNHLAVQAEYRQSHSGRSEELFFNHPESQPDDGFHSCNYSYLASVLAPGQSGSNIKFILAQSR